MFISKTRSGGIFEQRDDTAIPIASFRFTILLMTVNQNMECRALSIIRNKRR